MVLMAYGGISVTVVKAGPIWGDKLLLDTRKGLREALRAAGRDLVHKIEKASPVGVHGNIAAGWRMSNIHQLASNSAFEIYNLTPYLNAVEIGRPPKYVPYEVLIPWVKLKITPQPKEATRIAYYIARKKGKSHTPGQEFAKKAFEKAVPEYFANLNLRMGAFYAQYER